MALIRGMEGILSLGSIGTVPFHSASPREMRIQKGPRHKPKVVHTNLLKLFHGKVDRSWLQTDVQDSVEGTIEPHPPDHTGETGEAEGSPAGGREYSPTTPNANADPVGQDEEDQDADRQESEHFEIENEADAGGNSETSASDPSLRRNRKPPDRYGDWCV